MKFDTITIEDVVYYNDKEVIPRTGLYQYISTDNDTKLFVSVSIRKVAASAADEAISVDTIAGALETWIWDVAGVTATNLSVKTNGDSDARAVKPLRVISGDVTSLTASNGDSVNAQYLGIMKIIVEGSNYTLKEES